jgi:putative beta-barrel porin BBP2
VVNFSSISRLACCAAVAACVIWPRLAAAEVTVVPQGSIRYEHNSNIFAVPADAPLLVAQGDLTRADSIGTYVAGGSLLGIWGQQKLTAKIEGREVQFSHYSRLNHSEYLGDVDLHWTLNSRLDGNVDVRRDHSMALFMSRESTQLEVDTSQDATANANLKFAADFRLEAGILNHRGETPLPGFPSANILENTERLAVRYLGASALSYGFEFSQLNGKFSSSVLPSTYRQNNADLVFTYGVGSLSKLNGSIGYSNRKEDATGASISGLTGSIGLSRQLTGKTAITAEVRRAINVYVVGGGTEIDTSATLGANWSATAHITVTASASHTHSAYGQQSAASLIDSGRTDDYTSVNFSLDYQILRWLFLRPYGRYETRHSNKAEFTYDGSIVGIELRGRYE